MDKQNLRCFSHLDAFRLTVGFLALAAGAMILYRSYTSPSFANIALGVSFIGLGVVRLRFLYRWLKGIYPKN